MRQTDLIAFQAFGNVPSGPLGGDLGRHADDARRALAIGAAVLDWLRRTFRRRRPANAPSDFVHPGALLMLSEGVYSDFQVQAIVKVRRAFRVNEQAATFGKEPAPVYEGGQELTKRFAAWLEARGLVVVLDFGELWLGSYPDAEKMQKGDGLSVSWYE